MHEYTKYRIKRQMKKAGKFVMDNKGVLFKMGLMAAIVALPDVGFCQTAGSQGGSTATAGSMTVGTEISSLNEPLQKIGNALTGPIPAVFTLVSGALGAISWGMGWEQQITQRAIKCVGGGAVAMGAGTVLGDLGINAAGFLFM